MGVLIDLKNIFRSMNKDSFEEQKRSKTETTYAGTTRRPLKIILLLDSEILISYMYVIFIII